MFPKPEGYYLAAVASTIAGQLLTDEQTAALKESEQFLSNMMSAYYRDNGIDPRSDPSLLEPMMRRSLELAPGAEQAYACFKRWTKALEGAGSDE